MVFALAGLAAGLAASVAGGWGAWSFSAMRLARASRAEWVAGPVGPGRTASAVTEGAGGDGQILLLAAWGRSLPMPPRAASNSCSISKATLRAARIASG